MLLKKCLNKHKICQNVIDIIENNLFLPKITLRFIL